MGIQEWLFRNHAYKFNFRLFHWVPENDAFQFRELDYNRGLIYYREHIIMELLANERRIYLAYDFISDYVDKNSQIDSKLKHEYRKLINYRSKGKSKDLVKYPLNSENMYMLWDYVYDVQTKIDSGFEKYFDVLENEGLRRSEDVGYLEIEISNYYSFEKLGEMLKCYNELYSLLHFVLTRSPEKVDEDIESYDKNKSMVVESINVASDGILVAVGVGLIVEAIKSLIMYVLSPRAEREEYEKRRADVNNRINDNSFLRKEQEIYDTLVTLDRYYYQLEQCHNKTRYHIEQRVKELVHRIEELQGTNRVNLLV